MIKNQPTNQLKILFFSTLKLSACTFGGGYVIVALMKKKFVDELHWITEPEMLDITAIAQSSPGAIAVNASILLGHHLFGMAGALVGMLGTIIPPFVILSIVSVFYSFFRHNETLSIAITGVLAGVSAILFDTVLSMISSIIKQKKYDLILIMLCSFAAVYFFEWNPISIIVICIFIGLYHCLHIIPKRRYKNP